MFKKNKKIHLNVISYKKKVKAKLAQREKIERIIMKEGIIRFLSENIKNKIQISETIIGKHKIE
jgi:hypothetical protein